MADPKENRRIDPQLDASLSVLGDEGKEPSVDRVGPAPRPSGEGDMEREMHKDGDKAPGEGNLDIASERAARDSILDQTGGNRKS